jgi:hypothetical protein
MNTLKKKHPNDRDHRLNYDSTTHTYNTDTCHNFRNVSSITKSVFPPFDTNRVAANCSRSPKPEYRNKSPSQIMRMWGNSRILGNKLHDLIDKFYNEEYFVPSNLANSLQSSLTQFMTFNNKKKDVEGWDIFRTEWRIFDEELKVAGTLDAIFMDKDGKYHLVDWKRVKDIKKRAYNKGERATAQGLTHLLNCNYNQYALQLNTYKYILERRYGIKIETQRLVQFHPTLKEYKEFIVPEMKQEVNALLLPGYSFREPPPPRVDFIPNISTVGSLKLSKSKSTACFQPASRSRATSYARGKGRGRGRGRGKAVKRPTDLMEGLACSLSLLRRRRAARSK